MIDALLIYPRLGSMDSMVLDIPLSVLYAASESVKRGYNIKVLDLRGESENWQDKISEILNQGVRLAGISTMTGMPLKHSSEISRFIKQTAPGVKVVWGGPHPTIIPETVSEDYIDFVVRAFGSTPLAELISHLRGESVELSQIKGLSYKEAGKVIHNPRSNEFEIIYYKDIPYHLIDVNSSMYIRNYSGSRAFPIFSSVGCPYQCSFCLHPAVYRDINGPKWLAHEEDEILGHIEYVMENFNAKHIVFIDDTSFPVIKRIKALMEKVLEKKLDITMEFRGARVNEIMKMDDDFLSLMVEAGVRVIMVGVESGSDRILKGLQKGIKRDQVLEANRKLAKFPKLIAYYHFMYGAPGETYEDLLATKDLALQLLRENPSAYLGYGSDWKPMPGTKTLEVAEKEFGYKVPSTMDEWIQVDTSDADAKIRHSWYTDEQNNLIKHIQVSSFVIDNKIIKETKGNNSPMFILLRLLSRIYKPIAMSRYRINFYSMMIEYEVLRLLIRILPKIFKST